MNLFEFKSIRSILSVILLLQGVAHIACPVDGYGAPARQPAFHILVTGCFFGGNPGDSAGFLIDTSPGSGPDDKPTYFMAVNGGAIRQGVTVNLKSMGYALDSYDPLTSSRLVDPFVFAVDWSVVTGTSPAHALALTLWGGIDPRIMGNKKLLFPGDCAKAMARVMSDLEIPFRNGAAGASGSPESPMLIGSDGMKPFPAERKVEVTFFSHRGPGNHHSVMLTRPDTGDRLIYLASWGEGPPSAMTPSRTRSGSAANDGSRVRGEVRAILVDLAAPDGSGWAPGAGGVPPEKLVEAILWCLGDRGPVNPGIQGRGQGAVTAGAARAAKTLNGNPVVILGRHYANGMISIRKVAFIGAMGIRFLTASQGQAFSF